MMATSRMVTPDDNSVYALMGFPTVDATLLEMKALLITSIRNNAEEPTLLHVNMGLETPLEELMVEALRQGLSITLEASK